MLKLMYDGREFRLSDGRVVNLADANICVESIDTYQGFFTPQAMHEFKATVNGRYAVEIKHFNSEFELELWRNSCKPSGLFTLDNSWVALVINGEKVNFHVTRYSTSMDYTTEIEFTVPMYKENQ